MEEEGFECINAFSLMDTLEVLEEGIAPRFSLNGKPEPNFEVNYATSKYAGYSLEKRIPIWLKGRLLYTSEIELQIAYKWYLGTEKDFEDARHLYKIFPDKLNTGLLSHHIRELGVEKQAEHTLWKKDFPH